MSPSAHLGAWCLCLLRAKTMGTYFGRMYQAGYVSGIVAGAMTLPPGKRRPRAFWAWERMSLLRSRLWLASRRELEVELEIG